MEYTLKSKAVSAVLALVAIVASMVALNAPATAGTGIGKFLDCQINADDPYRPSAELKMHAHGWVTCVNTTHQLAIHTRIERRRPDGVWEVVATGNRNPGSNYSTTSPGTSLIGSVTWSCIAGPLRTWVLVSDNGVHHSAYSTDSVRLCG
jgi:hypothetical protein